MAAQQQKGGQKKLFGLPRTWAILAIVAGIILVLYLYYRSKAASGAAAQAALPQDTTGADTSTAAPALGGTPDSGSGQASLSGSDLAAAFGAQTQALTAGFQTQEQLIASLAGGYEQIAMTSEQQLGSLAAGLITLIPKPGSTTSTTGGGGSNGGGGSTTTAPRPSTTGFVPAGPSAKYNPKTGETVNVTTGNTIAPTPGLGVSQFAFK